MRCLLVAFSFLFIMACKPVEDKSELFPIKSKVLVTPFEKYDNFLPIAILDLRMKGIKDLIPVVFVSFDPDINDTICFPPGDYKDAFSFRISRDNKLNPVFNDKALKYYAHNWKYHDEGLIKYEKAKKSITNIHTLIDTAAEPEWWQDDETPQTKNGKKYRFICQVDIFDIYNDDCRMYVFYDEEGGRIKYIYQRT